MSQVMCVRSDVPYRNDLKTHKRFDYWNRHESNHFRLETANFILNKGPVVGSSNRHLLDDAFSYFSELPERGWSETSGTNTLNETQARCLFSKDEDMLSPVNREDVAFRSFLAAEGACGRTNRYLLDKNFTPERGDVDAIMLIAQQKISSILGDVPLLDDLAPSFGPGAAATCRKNTTARFKLSTCPSISNPATAIAVELAETMGLWTSGFERIDVVPGILEFVPKNFKTHRAIVIEPSLTGAIQRSVGSVLKNKLLLAGVDLFDQTINRERARIGSISGIDNCTIDLKMASDTVAYALVMQLLPLPWYELMSQLRSDRVTYKGQTFYLNKFSSMGNGFTFELESMIFYALGFGIAKHFGLPFDLTVYGDDLVCNELLARAILEKFPLFGFSVNTDKSFITGFFRESCGGDYFKGVDVRPFYLKGRVTNHKICCFYNHLMRKPHQDPNREIRDFLLSYIPYEHRNFGPDGYGDGHLVTEASIHEYGLPAGRKKGWSGFTFETFVENPTRILEDVPGDKFLPAYQASQISVRSNFNFSNVVFSQNVRKDLRSHYLKSFLRQCVSDLSEAIDHFVVRKSQLDRVRGRKIRVYVLG